MIDSLLDIGKDMDKVTGNEKIFFEDQNGPRDCCISEELLLNIQRQKILKKLNERKCSNVKLEKNSLY